MTVIVKVGTGTKVIVHLTNALSDDTVFDIHYSLKEDACHDVDFGQIKRNGKSLILSPTNTPLLLEAVGVYRFENMSSDMHARIMSVPVNTATHPTGDVFRLGGQEDA